MDNLNKAGQKELRKLTKAVEKFNAKRNEAITLMETDDSIYYETETTLDMGPEFIGEVSLSVEEDKVSIKYESMTFSGWDRVKTTNTSNAPIEDGDFDASFLIDELKYMMRGVNKAIKYFKKYNPDMTEEEEEKLLNDDSNEESKDDSNEE